MRPGLPPVTRDDRTIGEMMRQFNRSDKAVGVR
jgi:hypothetical protein